jgi:inosine-uridine nucleoside N-ribohydrolase
MSTTSPSVKVLVDTDAGSDIDDAVCLAYLLAQPRCELLGITTVTGQARQRAMIASALCKVAGKKVPIYPGAEVPLLVPQRQKTARQASALAKWEHDSQFAHGMAVEFMRQTIRDNPGEVVLLAIGPLTNLALLFAIDPEIPDLLKGLVLMCGMFRARTVELGLLEWNAMLDPHATAMVYGASLRVHRSIGLDVTTQVTMSAAQVRKRFRHRLLQPVLDMADVWFQERDVIMFHDPLAGATIFDDQICSFERGLVEIELESHRLRGLTHWKPGDEAGQHEVAVQVDSGRFFEHFFAVLG